MTEDILGFLTWIIIILMQMMNFAVISYFLCSNLKHDPFVFILYVFLMQSTIFFQF